MTQFVTKARTTDKRRVIVLACMTLSLNVAHAGGIDRSGQSISFLYEKGTYAQIDFWNVRPSINGTDVLRNATGNISDSYSQFGLAYKRDVEENLSLAISYDQSYGSNIEYAKDGSLMLGGTYGKMTAHEVIGLVRYKLSESFGIHGGLRAQRAGGNIGFGGLSYGALDGYEAKLSNDTALGYVLGASFEKPDIALRVAATYNSAIKHKIDTTENLAADTTTSTDVTLPQSVNLDFQTGVATNTFMFSQIRWVNWKQFKVTPQAFGAATNGASLTDLGDVTSYMIGVAQKFNDAWAVAASYACEKRGADKASPLGPYSGLEDVMLAVIYSQEKIKITPWIKFAKLGNAQAVTADTARADFNGSKAFTAGLRLGLRF